MKGFSILLAAWSLVVLALPNDAGIEGQLRISPLASTETLRLRQLLKRNDSR